MRCPSGVEVTETIVASVSLDNLTEQLELAEELRRGREAMLEPQDLPARYGRVIKAIDHVLGVRAVWRHGFLGRVTQDVNIALAAAEIDEFMRVAGFSGFEALPQLAGRWPKLRHKDTDIEVKILPDGGRPGTAGHQAPITIPHPSLLGAHGSTLRYIGLPALIELKLAAGRARDDSDIVELIRVGEIEITRHYLAGVHAEYVQKFDQLVQRAREQRDE
jgi:hypothetical protein